MKKKAKVKKELLEDLVDVRQQSANKKKSRPETQNFLQALQTSENRYRRLFETAQDGILILNAETGQIDDVNRYNRSFEEFFGQKREQIAGKSAYDLFPKELADIYHEKDLALLQNPGIDIYESILRDAGGGVHNVIFHKVVTQSHCLKGNR